MVGLEACATAHYWARELGALGHEVRLMPAQYVKAYIKRNKHDAADAAGEQRRRYLCATRMAEGHRNVGKDDLPFPVCKDRELGPALE